jgi:SAM-dependent methyltransferase
VTKLQGGDRFQYQSVVDHYRYRPDYPPAIYDKLFSFVSEDSCVLDIGCGPGKLSYPLAKHVAQVDAVDLSETMIEAARAVPGDDSNIHWIAGDMHTVELGPSYDLVVAGASIHWMDLDRLFSMLAPRMSERGRIAFVAGDAAVNHPWGREELELMKQVQLAVNDERPPWVDTVQFPAPPLTSVVGHPLFEREDALTVASPNRCTVDDYIGVFFSRQSFALDCMSDDVANRFREGMRELLSLYAIDGEVEFDVESIVEWGRLLQ